MWWCRRAPTARAQLGPHSSPPLTSRVRRAAGGATRKGPRAPRGLLARSWCGPPLLQLTPPCTGGGGLFAHKFASFPRTTRPATHPPFRRRFPGRASPEPLCTRVAVDACECRLPDLAPSQHRRRARSCARACGTADEEDPLPAATRCRAGQVAAHQPNVTTHRDAGCRTTLLVPLLVLPFIIPSHSPLRPPVPRTASPVGEVAGVWMAPSSLSCSPPALSAAQSPARAHAAPMLAAPPAQFRALPSLALHPPFCHADASAMLPRPRRALLTDWPQWTRCELVPYTRCELVPPGCIPCRLLQSHLQSCSPALERCLASSGA